MNRFRTLLTSLAVSAPLVFGAGIASAQYAPRRAQRVAHRAPPPAPVVVVPVRHRAQPLPVIQRVRPQLVTKTGTVQSLLFSRRSIRGVTLTDGSTVLLRNASPMFARSLRPGAFVRVRGYVMPTDPTIIRNATVATLRFRAPSPPAVFVTPVAPAPAPPPFIVAPAPIAVRGTIANLSWGANGIAHTIVLSNGQAVELPGSLSRAVGQRGVRLGERVAITAHRSNVAGRTTLIADTLTFADGTTLRAQGSYPYLR